jgi:hypothetical protein
MPLIYRDESAPKWNRWFSSECAEVRLEENGWNQRHFALFSQDWITEPLPIHDWMTHGAGAPTSCDIFPDFKHDAGDNPRVDDYKILALKLRADELRAEFETLSDQWRRDTRHLSLISKKIVHPAYLRIVGMGEAAIPLLLESLRDNPTHWFTALRATANTDPSAVDANPSQAREAWLSWGRSQGYID